MRGITLDESFISDILGTSLQENKKVEAKKVQESTEEEVEEHVCPLCESKLEKAIPQEKLEEHVAYFLGVINENFEVEGESLDEDVEVDEDEEVEEDSEDDAN